MAASFERLETSKKRLKVRWQHPVPMHEESLDFQSALKEIRGEDPRPLLLLRDCEFCDGKDHALLSRTLSNEKTLLFTQWVRCVKLDRRIVEESHPWHALFADEKPPHLLMCTWDGSQLTTLDGRQSQKKLWNVFRKILKADYQKDAFSAVRGWQRVLDKFDQIDSRHKELERQLDAQQAKGNDRRVQSIQKQIAKLDAEREEALAAEKRLIALILKHAPKAKTIDDFDAEAAADVRAGSGSGLLDRIRKDDKKKDKG